MQLINKFYSKALLALATFSLVILTSTLSADCKDDLAHRIAPVGSICVEGEECKSEVVVVAEVPKGPRAGSAIYGDYCAGCHASGVMNAPKTGSAAWKTLSAKGMPAMLSIAKKGKNAMPRMGGCNDCSDAELTASIQYMVDQ